MFKIVVVFAACLAVASAGVLHSAAFGVAPAAVAYANAPLYAAGGSQQVDVRHNYDGSLSSYTTTPFGYTSPFSSRYVAGAPAAPAAFAAPGVYAGAPAAYATAPAAYAVPAGYAASTFAVAAPFASPYGAAYAAGFSAPFAAAPAKVVV